MHPIEKTAMEMPLRLPGYEEQRKGYTLVQMDPLVDMPSLQAAATLRTQLNDGEWDALFAEAVQKPSLASR